MSTFWRNWDFDTGWQPEHFSISGQNVKFVTETKKNGFIEGFHQTWGDAQRCYVHSTPQRPLTWFPDLCYFFMTCRIFSASNSTEVHVLFTSLQSILILSEIVVVHAGVKSTIIIIIYIFLSHRRPFVTFQMSYVHIIGYTARWLCG